MQSYANIRQWAPILARRLVGGASLTSILSKTERALRTTGRRTVAAGQKGLIARNLSVEEVLSMHRTHWYRSESFVSDCSAGYLINRFLTYSFHAYGVFGITDRQAGRIEGVVMTEGTRRVNVLQCTVNESAVSEVHAVELVMNAIPTAESVIVPLLPRSSLASDFAAAGYFGDFKALKPRSSKARRGQLIGRRGIRSLLCLSISGDGRIWPGWGHH